MIKYTIVCPNCGKTKTFEKKFPSSRENRFCGSGCASSYNNTIRWADPENRKRQSKRLKEANKNPELNQKHREAARRRWNNPEYRKKTIRGIQESHQTPAYHAKASSIQKAICSRPEVKAARSKRMKKLWQNPEFRQKITEAVILQHQSQEYRDTMARIWTEEKRELASQQMKAIAAERDMAAVAQARWAKPGASKRHSEIVKAYWEDPEWAEQTLERQRKGCIIRPTKPERKLAKLLRKCGYNYKYTGDGTFWLARCNPDFIWNEKHKIIEMFGSYWHNESEIEPRTEHFANYGFETLFVWDYELDNTEQLLIKLKEFHQPTD